MKSHLLLAAFVGVAMVACQSPPPVTISRASTAPQKLPASAGGGTVDVEFQGPIDFPRYACRNRITGLVVIDVTVNPAGETVRAIVYSRQVDASVVPDAAGGVDVERIFDNAAIDSLTKAHWRFEGREKRDRNIVFRQAMRFVPGVGCGLQEPVVPTGR
jgi:hypothetical protein